jgi:hypothetical protein
MMTMKKMHQTNQTFVQASIDNWESSSSKSRVRRCTCHNGYLYNTKDNKNKINSKKEFEKRNNYHIYFRLILYATPFYFLCYILLFYSSPLLMTMALLVIVVIVNDVVVLVLLVVIVVVVVCFYYPPTAMLES